MSITYLTIDNFSILNLGLRVEDLFTDQVEDFKEAMSFVDPDVTVGRSRRIRRAIDLDVKHKNFDDYAPHVDQETFKFEIWDYADRINAREFEKSVSNRI
jgi:hypothetical protein